MGFYINPPKESKENFLAREGVRLANVPKWEDIPTDSLPVVLVNNGIFTAAGIAYHPQELEVFTNPTDPRPRKYYAVKIEKLFEVSDLPKSYVK